MIDGNDALDLRMGEEVVLQKRTPFLLVSIFIFVVTSLLFALGIYAWIATTAPSGAPREVTLSIPEGSTVKEIARLLAKEGVIRNETMFALVVRMKELDTALPSGEFLFKTPRDLSLVIAQLANHDHGIAKVRLTIPEGMRITQMLPLISAELPQFDKNDFYLKAKGKEGYLFPDTYFFFSTATSGDVLLALEENFVVKTKTLRDEATKAGKQWGDIVTMASIIEEEAVGDVDRKMVGGILWNRIKKGMRLQVDASFAYLLDKASSEITVDDLNMDSLYNTYRYAGLPPGPIANPGVAAIEAALYPTPSAYLYYLSDADGGMHYAKTFEEHKINKAKYLR